MLLSRSAEVALAAVPFLDPPGPSAKGRGVRELAQRANVPAPFLAKVLQRLADRGVLRSRRGRAGGFILGRPSAEITLGDVVLALSRREDLEKAFPRIAGVAGAALEPARRSLLALLQTTTLDTLATVPPEGNEP